MSDILTSQNKNINLNEKNIIPKRKSQVFQNFENNNKKKLEHIIDGNLKLNISLNPTIERKVKKQYSVMDKVPKININNIKKIINDNEKNKEKSNNHIIENIIEESENEKGILNFEESSEEKNININANVNKNNEKEKNYLKIIEDLEKKIKDINDFYSKKISNLNSDIKEKSNSILSLSNSNNSLRLSLESLTSRVDKLLYNSKKNNKIIHSKSTSDISLEHQLKVKENEIKNQQKLIKILTIDNKNIKSVIERYNLVDLNINLNNNLHEKDEEIKILQKKVHDYEIKLEEHNTCSEKIKTLNEQLLEYKKEIELQKIDIKKNHKNYSDLKNKVDKYGISSEKLKIFLKNKNIRKNSVDTNITNINTYDKKNLVNNLNENGNEENKSEKILSGNKTDRQDAKKVYYYYNKNNYKNISPIKKNKIENSKNEIKINKDGLINLFNSEELISIKKLFDDNEEKFSNFVKKINVIEKYISVKEKEMNQTIKIMENKMKKNNDLLKSAQNMIKDKNKELVRLNIEIKDLNQIKNLLIQKIKELNNSLNEEKNNNLLLKKENSKIKNSIFNIDGIIGGNIIKENNEKNNLNEKKNELDISFNLKESKINTNNKKEGYRTGPGLKIEEEKLISNNFFTNQPMIISKNLQDKDKSDNNNKITEND